MRERIARGWAEMCPLFAYIYMYMYVMHINPAQRYMSWQPNFIRDRGLYQGK